MDRAEAYLEHIRKLLRDNKVPELEEKLAEEPLLGQIHNEIKTIREIVLAFSAGDFSSAITARGIIPGGLKALQANLRHLIWQVQMVEKGDFSQEVRFMGEFSSSFNSMVRRLNLSLTKLRKNEETLMDTNNKLRREVEHMDALKESEARFKFLASHDPLTGILNRRSFIEMAELELADAIDLCVPCCLAMMDIDHFKVFNDTYGHLAGDEALRHAVKTVEAGLRKKDFVGRYGGEEFIFFFYGADEKTGFRILERLRENLAETPVVLENGPVSIHASFGLAGSSMDWGVFRIPGQSGDHFDDTGYIQKLISNADTALYAAKEAGRNQVMIFNSKQKTRKRTKKQDPRETAEICETIEMITSDEEAKL
jgi:diguanylate cyclase (GGDEF)-like protein